MSLLTRSCGLIVLLTYINRSRCEYACLCTKMYRIFMHMEIYLCMYVQIDR